MIGELVISQSKPGGFVLMCVYYNTDNVFNTQKEKLLSIDYVNLSVAEAWL